MDQTADTVTPEVQSAIEAEIAAKMQGVHTHLIEHGFTPHSRSSQGPNGTYVEQWWDFPRTVSFWPYIVLAGMILLFTLFILKGVPWS